MTRSSSKDDFYSRAFMVCGDFLLLFEITSP
jgi:hypothetical protein